MATKTWYTESADAALEAFDVSKKGLSSSEVEARLKKYGENKLPEKEGDGWPVVLLRQFAGPLILILTIAAIVSAFLQEWIDFGVIIAAILINTVIGFVQEYKAAQSLKQLQSLVQPRCVVRRDGGDVEVYAQDVVPGDILVLSAGDRVSADARIIEVTDLEVDESALTGESMPIRKSTDPIDAGTPLAERSNMLYAGTSIGAGRGTAIVVATGTDSELGRIAKLVEVTEEGQTPLQTELKRLARWLAILVVVVIAFVFFLGIASGYELFHMFETSVALAVAAIPEGMIIAVTITLAVAMQRILKRKALVRRLVAGETLGSVSVICTDKTGTITEGEMKVSRLVPPRGPVQVDELESEPTAGDIIRIIEVMMLCNNASVHESASGTEVSGSPTERALMEAGLQLGISYKELQETFVRYDEVPFDSEKKYMLSLNDWGSSGRVLLVKGAPERVMEHVNQVYDDGKVKKLVSSTRKKLQSLSEEMTEEGLRVLAVAYKPMEKDAETIEESDFKECIFLGFVGMQDPLRKEAKQQIALAANAGVRTVIITGDHPKTARAIGEQVGLVAADDSVVTGEDLDGWDDEQLKERVSDIDIYARVEPRHKIRIVDAWRARGEVVSMTGDGVNDAPALKAADIGVALGSGTEVAKGASDIVLLNNNLSTITAAIEEGRVIFDNIRKSSVNLLVSTFSELILIAGALVFRLPLPLLPTQILWVNLVEDSLPSMALAMEPGEPDVMKRPPRPRTEPVLNRKMLFLIFFIGLLTDAILLSLFSWYITNTGDIARAQTIMFTAVGIDSLLYVFAIRSFRTTIFRMNPFSNRWLVGAVVTGFILMAIARFHPFFQRVFEIVDLTLSDWILLLIMGMMKLIFIEIAKEVFIWREKRASWT